MGRHHVRNYAQLEGSELCAVVDADLERASRLAETFGARAYNTVEELLEREPELEAASVAVPTSLHHEIAESLLWAGKHLLVEKPLAASAEEAASLARLAAERSLVLAVGHVERFNPAVRELKRRVSEGEMGSLLSLVARRVGVMPPQIKDANVIVDLAIHDIDIFRYLLDADLPQEVYCNAGKAIAADRFDFADIFLRFDSVACFVQVNWVTPVKIRALSVTGTKGYAELEYVTQRLVYYPAHPAQQEIGTFADLEAISEMPPERVPIEAAEPLACELVEFLKAVRDEPAEIVTAKEGMRSMEVAALAVELAERETAVGR